MKKYWNGSEDMQAESNAKGIICGSFNIWYPRLRDYCEQVDYELHELLDNGDTWDVSAVVTKSECKRFSVGDIVTFELPKDTDINDLSLIIKEQFIQEY